MNLVAAFKYGKNRSLANRLALTSEAITFHQGRAEALWLQAGKRRTVEEQRAIAQAELASFVFAYLNGETRGCEESTIEALQTLGRQGEVDILKSFSRG